jgi:hypothetical protein
MTHQIHRSPAYLSHNKHGYCVRLKVPDDLQCHVNRKELRYSLKTGYLRVAKNRARFIVGNIQMLFRALRRGDSPLKQLTPQLVNDLIRQYRDRAIEDAKRPVNRNHDDPTRWDYNMREVETEEDLYSFMHDLSTRADWYKFKAVTGNNEGADEVAEKLCKTNGIAHKADSDEFRSLCRGMLCVDSEAASVTLDILEKEYPTVLRKHGHQIR